MTPLRVTKWAISGWHGERRGLESSQSEEEVSQELHAFALSAARGDAASYPSTKRARGTISSSASSTCTHQYNILFAQLNFASIAKCFKNMMARFVGLSNCCYCLWIAPETSQRALNPKSSCGSYPQDPLAGASRWASNKILPMGLQILMFTQM